MSLFHAAIQPALDANGNPISGARWRFTLAGTTTNAAVYADDDLSTSLGAYVSSNAAGRFPVVFLDDSVTYRARLWADASETGTPIKDIDPANSAVEAPDTEALYPVLEGEVGAFNLQYPVGDARRYGVFPDGVTNWESTNPTYLTNFLRTGLAGIPLFVPRGYYATGWNWTNRYGYGGLSIEFEDGAEFGGILHFISSGSPASRIVPTAVAVGATTTITVSGGHGLTVGDNRYITFAGMGMAALDGQNVFATITSSTQLTVAAATTGQVWSTAGEFSDVKMRDVVIEGSPTSYDRIGAIATRGWRTGVFRLKSDPTKSTIGKQSRGAHIYLDNEAFYIEGIVADDCGPHSEHAENHAAIALDGPQSEPSGFIGFAHVKDSAVNALLINGNVHIGDYRCDGYGRSVPGGTLANRPPGLTAGPDPLGDSPEDRFAALILSRACARIDKARIDQKQGYATGRSSATYGIIAEGGAIDYYAAGSFGYTMKGSSIGHLELGGIQGTAVAVGAFGDAADLSIERCDVGIVRATSVLVTDPAHHDAVGLLWCVHGHLAVGRLTAGDTNIACLVKVDSNADASYWIGSATVHQHRDTAFWLRGHGSTGPIEIKDRSGAGTGASIRVDGGNSFGANLGPVHGRATATQNKRFLIFAPQRGSLGAIDVYGYAPTTAGEAAVRIGDNNANRIVAASGGYLAHGGAAAGTGLIIDGTEDSNVSHFRVENFTLGVDDAGTNTRLSCLGNVATSNTTNSALPVGQLGFNQNNTNWSV